jgi:hypothetical protein
MASAIRAGQQAFRGRGVSSHGQAPRRFSDDRSCSESNCETRLSVYNRGTTCWTHTELVPVVMPAPRRRADEPRVA